MNTLDIHDLVKQLTAVHTHREPYTVHERGTTWTRGHVTDVPSLIDQLQHAQPASQASGSGSGGFTSRPAARIEALDTLIHIDLAASRWVRDLGEDDPGDTAACIRRLHALHASAHHCGHERGRPDCCTAHEIEHDIRGWWNQARIITGWDSPAWRPDNTCPVCSERRTLRVRLAAEAALCVDCRSLWDSTTIGLLADHIRTENAEDTPAAS